MTAVAAPAYRIVAADDEHSHRVLAVTDLGVEICGAYRPRLLNDWRLFVSKLVSDQTQLPQPHKAHVCSREDAGYWVDTAGWWYTRVAVLEAENAALRQQVSTLSAAVTL